MIIAFLGLKTSDAAFSKSLLNIHRIFKVSPSNVYSYRIATPIQFSYELPILSYRTRLYLLSDGTDSPAFRFKDDLHCTDNASTP